MTRVPKNAFQEQFLTEDDISNETLRSDGFVDVAELTADQKHLYARGAGDSNRMVGNIFTNHFDLASSPDGGTTINSPKGVFRWVIYESTDKQSVKDKSGTYSLQDYREMVNEARTDKAIHPLEGQVAMPQEVLALQVKVTSAYDGEVVQSGSSDSKLTYSEARP